ncbi:MAG: acyltransferase family protein, partial [Pseudomonadota bacterium]
MASQKPRAPYRAEIDGLRAVAIAAVMAHHAGVPLPGGYLGVDIFFVISGFLITSILMRDLRAGCFSLVGFYERRARRILPALVVVCLACIPLGWVLALPDQLKLLGQSLVAVVTFSSNVLFWLTSGYFGPAGEEIPLLHTWSLAVEEQFYLFFPLLMLVVWRPGLRGSVALPLIAGLAVLSLAAAVWAQGWDRNAAFYLLPFRAWELLAGVLLALWLARRGRPLRSSAAPSLMGLGLIGLGLVFADPWSSLAPLWALLPVAGTLLIIAFAGRGTWTHWALTLPPMIGIGLISYSLYLWHQPVFAFARMAQFMPPSPWQMAGLVVLTGLLAWFTWRFVEQPCRNRRLMRRRTVWRGAVTAGAVLGTLGLAAHIERGFGPARFSPEVLAILDTATASPLRSKCHFGPDAAPPPEEACTYFADAPPTWAVFGDSHGVELAYALGERLAERDESLIHLTASACPPALTFDPGQPGCADWVARTVAWLEDRPEIHTIVLAWRHNMYLFGDNAKTFPELPDAPFHIAVKGTNEARRSAYWVSFETLVSRLSVGGRRILVLEPVPEIGRSIQKYVLHCQIVEGKLPTISAEVHHARNAYVRARLSGMSVDTLTASVDCSQYCSGAAEGYALLFDD